MSDLLSTERIDATGLLPLKMSCDVFLDAMAAFQ